MREMKCAVCEQIYEYENKVDFSKLEEADLGGQPKFADGDSYETMVQCCPNCGYCNFDISKNVLASKKLLDSEQYKYILTSEDMPASVSNMVAVAYIYESQGNYLTSAKAHSYASKMLENIDDAEKSAMFKEQEVRLLLMYISSENFKKHPDIKVYQYLIDALRRLKKFDKAIKFCEVACGKTQSSVQKNIFMLEKSLCMNYISDSHKFSQKNGEFNNFYQILVRGFQGVQSEKSYKDTYKSMRDYLEKSAYFPIADGADFIMRVDEAEFAGMDNMIVELKKTYDRVRGFAKKVEEVKQLKIHQEIKKEEQPVKILTLNMLNQEKEEALQKEKEEIERVVMLEKVNEENEKIKQEEENSLIEENAKLKSELHFIKEENNKTNEKLDKLQERYERKTEELLATVAEMTKISRENETLTAELEKTINSRREITADLDMTVYNLEVEKKVLLAEIESLKEEAKKGAFVPKHNGNIDYVEDESKFFSDLKEEEIKAEDSAIKRTQFSTNNEAFEENKEDNNIEFDDLFEEDSMNFLKEDINNNIEEAVISDLQPLENNEIGDNYEDMAEFILDEITEEMILNIAKISGQIDVSEVQGMLLVGYKNAKYALDKIAADGKIEEIEEDLYKYIEV